MFTIDLLGCLRAVLEHWETIVLVFTMLVTLYQEIRKHAWNQALDTAEKIVAEVADRELNTQAKRGRAVEMMYAILPKWITKVLSVKQLGEIVEMAWKLRVKPTITLPEPIENPIPSGDPMSPEHIEKVAADALARSNIFKDGK